MPGTRCGPVELIGPLNEHGFSEQLVNIKANISDTIVIKCQLSRTDPDVNYRMYNPMLKICITTLRDVKELYPIIIRNRDKFQIQEGDVMNYSINITASVMLDRSVIICGAHYQPFESMDHEYCYSGSAAIIVIEDHDQCDTPSTSLTPSQTTPTTPPTTSSPLPTTPSTKRKLTTPAAPPANTPPISPTTCTSFAVQPTISTTSMLITTVTPTTPVSTTSQPTPESEIEPFIAVNPKVFYPVVGIAMLVCIILLVANGIQLTTIVKNRRAAREVTISATNSTALDLFSAELEYGTDQNGEESEEDTIQNNAATG